MIYTPSKHPKEAIILITIMVLLGVLGGIFIHRLFVYVALVFWIQYTAVLVKLQIQKKKKKKKKSKEISSLTAALLNPYVRFIAFLLLATEGLVSAIIGRMWMAYLVLILWWLFAINFYHYYKKNPKELKHTT